MFWPTIKSLFTQSRPAAVVGRIRTIVIASFKSHSFGALSHIGEKVFETSEPSFTNCNSTSAIMVITSGVGVKTSVFHCLPTTVSLRTWYAVPGIPALSMLQFGLELSAQATARFRRTVKVMGEKATLYAAIASAEITGIWRSANQGKDSETTELFASKIDWSGHKLHYEIRWG